MDAGRWRRLSAAFEDACESDGARRREIVEELARVDPGLARELEAMLAADAAPGGALAAGAFSPSLQGELVDPGESGDAFGESPVEGGGLDSGTRLGSWRLERRLGAGGMGEVWSASRADGAFAQVVAIKLLKRGLETEGLLRRFHRERQILARLDHPGIARLIDAGSAGDGRPYFVMERVEGVPITSWAAAKGLDLDRRLELIEKVTAAVEFAHRNLVVHRDLKPSNILVADDGTVKLLDFGIAKLLEQEAGETQVTELEGRALTPSYAAPEQFRGEPVTTATDVYALGVLLYELLTGELPYRRRAMPLPQLLAQLDAEAVAKPSAVVRQREGDGAERRQRDRLARQLAGDVDTIVLKALSREPSRRYPTAAALADDLARYRGGRPIAARPDTAGYRLGKFVRRHRVAVAAASAALVALLGGLAAALWQAERATREAQRAGRVREFLVSIFESRDPDLSRGRRPTLEGLVDESVGRLPIELAGEPEVEADLSAALARAEMSLGRLESAARLAERARTLRVERFGARSAEAADSATTLGAIARARGEPGAEVLLREALDIARSAAGEDAVETSRARVELAAVLFDSGRFQESQELAARAYEALLARLGADHRNTLAALRQHSEAAIHGGDRKAAETLLRAVLAEGTPETSALPLTRAVLRCELAELLVATRRNGEAREAIERAIAGIEELLGAEHLEFVRALHVRGMVRGQAGEFAAARQDTERALAILDRVDPDHPLRATLLRDMGHLLLHVGEVDAALDFYRQDAERTARAYGPDSTRSLEALSVQAHALHQIGRDDEALAIVTRIATRLRAEPDLGATLFPSTVFGLQSKLLALAGRIAEAIEVSRFEVELLTRRGAAVDPGLIVEAELGLATNLIVAATPESLAEARRIAERALLPLPSGGLGLHADLPERLLGRIDAAEGRWPEACRHFERALAAGEAAGWGASGEQGETHLELGLALEKTGDLAAARREFELAESILFRRRGRDADSTRSATAALARFR